MSNRITPRSGSKRQSSLLDRLKTASEKILSADYNADREAHTVAMAAILETLADDAKRHETRAHLRVIRGGKR
jgi:hypothetical protein